MNVKTDKSKKDEKYSHIIRRVSKVFNVTQAYVRMVVNGTRNNKDILDTYNFMVEQDNKLYNKVVTKVEKKAS